jgi:hypothetical protein
MVAAWGTTTRPVTFIKMPCPMCRQESDVAVSQEVSYGTLLGLITIHATGDKYFGQCNSCHGMFQFSDEGTKWLHDNKISLSYWKWNIVGCSPIPALILFFYLLPFGLVWAVLGIFTIVVLFILMFRFL